MDNGMCASKAWESGTAAQPRKNPLRILDVTTGILCSNGRFFCGRRKTGMSMAGKWEFPGGKIERGETAEQCVVRELAEELHVSAAILAKLGIIEHDYDDFRIRLHVFVCEIRDDSVPFSNEHDDAGWRSLDELKALPWDECDIRILPELAAWMNGENFSRQ